MGVDEGGPERRPAQPHAGNVDDVQGRAGGVGVGDDLLESVEDARLDGAAVAPVDEDRDAPAGGEPKDFEDLLVRFVRQVGNARSNAEGGFVEAAGDTVDYLLEFFGMAGRSAARSRGRSVPESRMTAMRARDGRRWWRRS
jgi:hypothetical protein